MWYSTAFEFLVRRQSDYAVQLWGSGVLPYRPHFRGDMR